MKSFLLSSKAKVVFFVISMTLFLSVFFQNCSLSKFSTPITKISTGSKTPSSLSSFSTSSNFDVSKNAFVPQNTAVANEYDLIPMLSDPNIGVHWGNIANNMPQVDRIVNIDTQNPSVQNSNWALSQWKKSTPLMENASRSDFVNTNSSHRDGYLGKPKFEILSPVDSKFGQETSLRIYTDTSINSNVFEITSRNGWLNIFGGSNVFLSADIADQAHNQFDSPVELTFNGKLKTMTAQYSDSSSNTRNQTVVGQGFLGFYAMYTNPNNGATTGMFIQILLSDTRGGFGEYSNCQMHGANPEIVFTGNIDGTFQTQAASSAASLQPAKYNLNKYLCYALKKNYNCPGSIAAPDFASQANDLKHWKITSFYTGLETQAAGRSAQSEDIAGDLKGSVEVSMQYSNLRISTNKNLTYANCDAVLGNTPVAITPAQPVTPTITSPAVPATRVAVGPAATAPVAATRCTQGNFNNGSGQLVQYTCNCGVFDGAVLQPDGCYHRIVKAAVPAQTPAIAPVISAPVCSEGTFVVGTQTIQYSCGCGVVAGGVLQTDGCYHKVITQAYPNCSKGEFQDGGGRTINYFCNCGPIAGGTTQPNGCYHRAK